MDANRRESEAEQDFAAVRRISFACIRLHSRLSFQPSALVSPGNRGDWPQLALEAYQHLNRQPSTTLRVDLPPQSKAQPEVGESQNGPQPSDGPDLTLLADIRQIFTQSGATRISSKQRVEALRTRQSDRAGSIRENRFRERFCLNGFVVGYRNGCSLKSLDVRSSSITTKCLGTP